MDSSHRRAFSLSAAMALVAATAVGIAWARAYASTERRLLVGYAQFPTPIATAAWLGKWPPFLLAPWTAAVLALGSGRNRPRASSPGLAACGVATATLAAEGLVILGVAAAARAPMWWAFFHARPAWPGPAVAGCWIALALGGRWRPEPAWDDRLGRALGAAWIAVALASYGFTAWVALSNTPPPLGD